LIATGMSRMCSRRNHAFLEARWLPDWLIRIHIGALSHELIVGWYIKNYCSKIERVLTDSSHHESHAVEIFDLAARSQRVTFFVHRNVHIAS